MVVPADPLIIAMVMIMVILMQGHDAAIGIMAVIVVMVIESQAIGDRGPEQGAEFRISDNAFGPARAADVMVQADHPVRGGHDHVQIMGDH